MLSGCCYNLGRGGQLLQQVGVVCLNTVFLGAKVIESVPARVGGAALFGLSCMSVVGLPYQYTMLKKTSADLAHSWSTGKKTIQLASAIKAMYVSASVLLNAGNFVAAVAGLLGEDAFQEVLYKAMMPAGEGAIAVGVALELSYLYFFWKVLKQTDDFQEALPLLSTEALSADLEGLDEHKQLASLIRYSMDKDTLADLIKNMDLERLEELSALAAENIKTQRNVALGGKLVLSLIGYSMMAVEKYYTPNSVEAAVINEIMSLLYTADYGLRLGCEVRQRNAIAAASVEHIESQMVMPTSLPSGFTLSGLFSPTDLDPLVQAYYPQLLRPGLPL